MVALSRIDCTDETCKFKTVVNDMPQSLSPSQKDHSKHDDSNADETKNIQPLPLSHQNLSSSDASCLFTSIDEAFDSLLKPNSPHGATKTKHPFSFLSRLLSRSATYSNTETKKNIRHCCQLENWDCGEEIVKQKTSVSALR